VKQGQILEGKYDAVVANPPYMGNKFMNALLKAFGKSSYPEANRDLFAIFTQRLSQLIRPYCHLGLMTPLYLPSCGWPGLNHGAPAWAPHDLPPRRHP
jgi:hypothetical protein